MKPKLSIVIPAYNEEEYLLGALTSIARQSQPPDEVIVVDNNSTDRTAVVAASFPFVRVLHESVQGIAPTRNRGFDEAKGQLIARLDADTRLPPYWVERAHALCDPHADEIYAVTGSADIYDMPDLAGRLLAYIVMDQGFFRGSRLVLGYNALYGSNMVITRAAWQRVRQEVCLDSKFVHEDVDLASHLAKYGHVAFDNSLQVRVSRRGFVGESPVKVLWRLRAWRQSALIHRALPLPAPQSVSPSAQDPEISADARHAERTGQ